MNDLLQTVRSKDKTGDLQIGNLTEGPSMIKVEGEW
jgi:hypothetical protein